MPNNTEVLVIGYSSKYYKVKVGNEIGYINEMFLPKNEALNRIALHGKPDKRIKIEKSQSTKATQKTYTPSTSSSSQDRTIYTGPRGGKYYINSKGKKVYISKKKK